MIHAFVRYEIEIAVCDLKRQARPATSLQRSRAEVRASRRRLRIEACGSTDGRAGVESTFALSRRDGRALTEEDERDDHARDRYQGRDDNGD